MTDRVVSRRRLLVTAATVVGLGGCSESTPDGSKATGPGTDPTEGPHPRPPRHRSKATGPGTDSPSATVSPAQTDTNAGESGTTADEVVSEVDGTQTGEPLDKREANVVGVEVQREDGDYRFSVTLYHDDDGEDGYANWWQVERIDGEQLGRRELLHAHSTDPFTRSETITVPEDVSCVVVRGHDQTHEYGGRAMLVALPSGETTTLEQGPEPDTPTEADCP